ncbi:hypothetical protein [Ekhidna sp.]|uniref:hypothetical protein n=1 Tax=Ekhidna sp. TaxID=2608089 RepID=UPI003CCB952B
MIRKPTYAGKIGQKDYEDILFWAFEKTPEERLIESWRLHCLNHGISQESLLDKNSAIAKKRL